MLTDCPHCYARVVAKADGSCPACQRDLLSVANVDSMWVSLRVAQGDVLPPVCSDCGEATQLATKVRKSKSDHDDATGWIAVVALGVLSWLAAAYFILRGIADTNLVEVKMPQCELCAANGRPQPEYVDFGNARMTFVVHRNLRDSATD